MKRIVIIGILIASVSSLRADLREQSLALVDSAYSLAVSGEYARAISLNEDGLNAVPEDSTALRCEFYSCLLYCYHRLGDYERALEYGERCLAYDEQQGTPQDLSASLGNLAGIYSSAGQNEVAEAYLRRAIDIENELLNTEKDYTPKSLAVREAMLGEVLLAKDSALEEALAFTQDALTIDRQLGRRLQEGMRLAQIGHIYAALGDRQSADAYTSQALQIARETGNKMTEVLCLLQLGCYEEAAEQAHEYGLKKQEYEACMELGDLKRAMTLKNELINEENQRQLIIAQVRHDTYNKEQELAKQKTRNKILTVCALTALLAVCVLALILFLQRRRKQESPEEPETPIIPETPETPQIPDFPETPASSDTIALTDREKEVVKLLCEGLKGKDIAERMNVSLRAVNSHKTNIFNKLGISSSVELVRYAVEHDLL
ncbi:MAG: tetratricopeptide repeat protein [Paludibacteraceae bacterium]|nr:tetratricopeptide repeat protein [Paludibacteraceae bacterium]